MKRFCFIFMLIGNISTWGFLQGPQKNQICQLSPSSTQVNHDQYFYYRFLDFTVSTPVLNQKGYACAAIAKDPMQDQIDYLIISADDGSEDLWIARDEALQGVNILDNKIRDYPIIKKQIILRLETKERAQQSGGETQYDNDIIFLRNFATGSDDDYRKADFTAFYDKKNNRMMAIYDKLEVSSMFVRVGLNLKFNRVKYFPIGKEPIDLKTTELQKVPTP